MLEELLEQREERLLCPVQILEHDRARRVAEPSFEISSHTDGELTPPRVRRQLGLRCIRVRERQCREFPGDRSRLQFVQASHPGDA